MVKETYTQLRGFGYKRAFLAGGLAFAVATYIIGFLIHEVEHYRAGEISEFDLAATMAAIFQHHLLTFILWVIGATALFVSIAWLIGRESKLRQMEQRRKYEEVLEEKIEELETTQQELKDSQERLVRSEKLAAIGQLGSSVAHELRNPLGVISNSVYYLDMKLGNADEKVKRHLEILEKEVATSNKIITDLLDFARPKEPLLEELAINSIVGQALSRATIPKKIEVSTQVEEDLPRIMGDPEQLERVLLNIISNAAQAMPKGGRLLVRTCEKEGFIEVELQDTGTGIPEENLEKVFDPLFTTRAKGVGLGLAVSKSIVEAHRGRIEVRSGVGEGTTFAIKLPMKIRE